MIDTRGIAFLMFVGIGAITVAPYLILALIFGVGSLWAIIPGFIWFAALVGPMVYWRFSS